MHPAAWLRNRSPTHVCVFCGGCGFGGSEGYDAPYIGYQIMYANRYLLSSNATFNSVCLWGVQCVFMGGGVNGLLFP